MSGSGGEGLRILEQRYIMFPRLVVVLLVHLCVKQKGCS